MSSEIRNLPELIILNSWVRDESVSKGDFTVSGLEI
jgi:hypothetical protein